MAATATTIATVERVYREHGKRMWRALLAYSHDRDVATDALAEAFAQLLHHAEPVRDPAAWAWRAAFRIAAGQLKERSRIVPAMAEPAVPVEESAGDLLPLLARLSPKQRGALVLHYYVGYSVKEIAEILGSTSGAVKVHLSSGRKRLRNMLEEDHDA